MNKRDEWNARRYKVEHGRGAGFEETVMLF